MEPESQELSNGVKVTELIKGKGVAVRKNSQVKVIFTCQVDESKAVVIKDSEYEFTLGSAGVVEGWNIGLIGAKKGSRRIVHCPPNTAYGAIGFPPLIPPNSSLNYTFDVVMVKAGK